LNIPKRSLYQVLTRLQNDGIVHKRKSGRTVLYTRKDSQHIQQLESLLTFCNPDSESIRGNSQQDPKTHLDPQKSDHFEKSDQNSDHFSEKGESQQIVDLLTKHPKPLPEEEYRNSTNSQQIVNNTPQSDQKSDHADQTEPLGPIPVDPNEELEEW